MGIAPHCTWFARDVAWLALGRADKSGMAAACEATEATAKTAKTAKADATAKTAKAEATAKAAKAEATATGDDADETDADFCFVGDGVSEEWGDCEGGFVFVSAPPAIRREICGARRGPPTRIPV